jgi:hypothetical protein
VTKIDRCCPFLPSAACNQFYNEYPNLLPLLNTAQYRPVPPNAAQWCPMSPQIGLRRRWAKPVFILQNKKTFTKTSPKHRSWATLGRVHRKLAKRCPASPDSALDRPDFLLGFTFRDSFWGKGLGISQEEENVERGNEPVDLCNIADPLPPTRRVIKPSEDVSDTWGSWGQRFLVRSEYYETEQAAALASKIMDVFVVTGQPGIGLPFLFPSSAEPNV